MQRPMRMSSSLAYICRLSCPAGRSGSELSPRSPAKRARGALASDVRSALAAPPLCSVLLSPEREAEGAGEAGTECPLLSHTHTHTLLSVLSMPLCSPHAFLPSCPHVSSPASGLGVPLAPCAAHALSELGPTAGTGADACPLASGRGLCTEKSLGMWQGWRGTPGVWRAEGHSVLATQETTC